MEQTKICPRCGRALPLSAFNKNKAAKDGLQTYCRECKAETQRAYQARVRIKKAFAEPLPKAFEELLPPPAIPDATPVNCLRDASTAELAAELKRRQDFSLSESFSARSLLNALYDLGYRGELTIMVQHTVKLTHE